MNYSYFAGIDLSKKTYDVSLLDQTRTMIGYQNFDNTLDGFDKLLSWICSKGVVVSEVLFCAEDMGNYATDLFLASIKCGFHLSLVCPLSVKRSLGIQRGKNDKIDSKRIAEYALSHLQNLSLVQLPEEGIISLRSWLMIRETLVKQKVATIKLLETVTNNQKLSDVTFQIVLLEEELLRIKEKIKNVELKMEEVFKQNSSLQTSYELLTSIVGVGLINAVVLICYTNNFKKFSDHRKFACYCGVAPFEHSSGVSIRGKTQVSSLANTRIKTYLTGAALTATCHDPQLKKYYQRKVKEGKHKASVLNAVKAKIIARCFAVIRRQIPFVKLAV